MQNKTYLFVVAHADDEVIGAGATINKLAKAGNHVYVCVMNSVSDIRCRDSAGMMSEMELSHKVLGIEKSYIGDYQTMCFNATPQRHLVEFIEKAILDCQPDVIVTHHPSDLHSDHQQVSVACKAAARMSQRQTREINKIKAFYYFEVLSSTDWGFGGTVDGFRPDTYVPISVEDFTAKMDALRVYSEGYVIRNQPHPRSFEVIKANLIRRGAEIGHYYAEAFQTVFREGL